MNNSIIKIALVGAGGWGRQHARILAERPDVEFCGIAGRTPEKTRVRAEMYGVPFYTDIQTLLEKTHPDLVSLCLPNKGHFDATLEIIRAGYPLLVEKPLVFSLDEADVLLREAAQRDLFFAINFNHRYARPVQMAQQTIQDGRLGQVVHALWRFGGEGGSCFDHDNLIETQCHGFDMLEFLCGPVDSVAAQMTDMTGKGYSTLSVALHFATGGVGAMIGSYDASYAYPDTHLLEINGTSGRIVIDDTVRRFSYQAVGNETAEVWQAGYFNDEDREFHKTFDKYFDVMLDAFRKGNHPPVPAQAGARALALAQACIQSFETGVRVAHIAYG
ncbi:MAG: Gfo/Idh/MocA family oxidoreductase [Candidatus Latescibacteria bacterium]|jgi:predicted dehydrogenase|nr:Gfo/Idh/MocA family oxidoreductase [Candidatus Latescibacterota bacterium]